MWVLHSIVALASPDLQAGDLVFHESTSQQAAWLKTVTKSRYTHVGLVIRDGDGLAVIEAVQPVQIVPIKQWIARGVDDHVIVRRPIEPLSEAAIEALGASGRKHLGKPYDLAFSWDEDRLYCTELVAKAYEEATGWEIGTRRPIRSWQISDPRIEKAMGARGMNLDEQALAPVDLLDDPRFIDPTKPSP